MPTLVIAPDQRQFEYFVRKESEKKDPHNSGERTYYQRALRPDQLFGYHGEILVLNRHLIPSRSFEEFVAILTDPLRRVRDVYT